MDEKPERARLTVQVDRDVARWVRRTAGDREQQPHVVVEEILRAAMLAEVSR